LRIVVAGSLNVVVAVVVGPLWLEVWLGLDGLLEDSGICRALPPYVSRLTATNAKLVVELSLFLRGEIVHPVHLHREKLHVTEIAVNKEVLFRRKA
jgi:hypothetical protein